MNITTLRYGERREKMEKSKKNEDMIFKDIKSLQPVVDVINEASITLGDPTRTIKDSPLIDVLSNALGAGGGAGVSFLALYGLGITGLSAAGITTALATAGSIVGGGMAAGVLVLGALPVAGVALTGGVIAKNIKRKQLREVKKDLYNEAEDRLKKIEEELAKAESDTETSEDRFNLLKSLKITLGKILVDLQHDLML